MSQDESSSAGSGRRNRQRRYYVKFSQAPFEEDMTHEFKGHRNLCKEELPKWTQETKTEKGSRKAVSRNLCGFLNTGLGGIVYCGIVDNGEVHGLKLTQYQKDHVLGGLHDLMSRYTPPVAPQRYTVRFVPVLGNATKEEEREELAKYDSKDVANSQDRQVSHVYRSPHYCWCDKDMMAQFSHGIVISDYVIEIVIKPWNVNVPNVGGLGEFLNLHPIHADEEGKIFFRRQASLVQYSTQEIANLSRYEATNRCQNIIEGLKKEIALVEASIARKRRLKGGESGSSSS